MVQQKLTTLATLVLTSALGASAASAQKKMYFGQIHRADVDGSNIERILTTQAGAIAIDPPRGKLYWANTYVGRIQRANLDGSNVEDLTWAATCDVAIDSGAGKMYWTNCYGFGIQRANLDGSAVEDVITTAADGPWALALDLDAGKIYWTEYRQNVKRANLDGSGVEEVVPRIPGGLDLVAIALDPPEGKMYLVRYDVAWGMSGDILRANLDGSALETLLPYPLATDIALDLKSAKMYWTNLGGVRRANLDGSAEEDLISGLSSLYSIGLALTEPCCGVGGRCEFLDRAECDALGGTPLGHGTICEGDADGDGVDACADQCPGVNDLVFAPDCIAAIPTTSSWGVAITTILFLIGGKIYFGRARQTRTATACGGKRS